MKYAIVNNERVEPTPKIKGVCPGCGEEVIAKCGAINIWHWAHKNADCDPWYEPEGDWHRELKNKVPKEYQEVVLGEHRADIYSPDWGSPVIEIQNSPISPQEINEREVFYKQFISSYPHKLVWVVNGADFEDRFCLRMKDGYFTFRWYHPRKVWSSASGMLVFHFPKKGMFFHVKKSYNEMSSGWGDILDEDYIFRRMFYNCSD